MKRKHTKGGTKGSKKPAKHEDDCSLSSPKGNVAMQSKRVTRSQAATIQKSPIQIPDIAPKPEKGTLGAAASKSPKLITARRFVEKNDGVCTNRGKQPTKTKTKGTTCKSPKLTCARRCVERSDGVSTNRGKQQTEDFTDETAHHENQDTYPFMASASPSSKILYSFVAKEKSNAHEAHSYQLTEMAAMMNADIELHQCINPTIPSSDELVKNNLASNAKEINKAHKALSMGFTEMAAIMCHSPSDDEEEADSALSLIDVEGYLVKKEIAPLLKKIIDKYKDIANDCIIKEKGSHVPILEFICLTCQKLGEMSFKDVNDDWLNGMLLALKSFQNMGFDFRWLSERLEDISKLKRLLDLRPVITEADSKHYLQQHKIKMLEQQIDLLNQQTDKLKQQTDMLKLQLSAEEADFFVKKMKHDKVKHNFNQDMKDLTPKGFQHWSNDLLYGLI